MRVLAQSSLLFIFLFCTQFLSAQAPDISPDDVSVSAAKLPEAAELLGKYVSIPSESGSEAEAGNFLANVCRQKGLHVTRLESDSAGINFIASLYPLERGKPNIIFLNHIDVVHPGNSDEWLYHPYSGAIAEDKIWGRGSIDNKGLAVIQLMALSSFVPEAQNKDFAYNISILSVSGEETGGERGSAVVSEKHLQLLNPAVVIGEGSCGFENMSFIGLNEPFFGISIADKSMLWLELHVHTEEMGHASVNGGNYPNKKLVEGLARLLDKPKKIQFTEASLTMFRELGKLAGGFKGFALRHINWFIFRPTLKKIVKKEPRLAAMVCNTITLTHFHNPDGDINQHSGEARAYLDCRLLPGFTVDEMIDDVRRVIRDTAIHIEVLTREVPARTSEPELYFDALSESIRNVFNDTDVIPVLFPATTDNNYFRGNGFPVYGSNPFIMSMGQIGSIHNSNEYMDVEDLIVGTDVFKEFIARMLNSSPRGLAKQ